MSYELIKRLRDTPNWRKESFGRWKDRTSTYDRAPFEAADRIATLEARVKELEADYNICKHSLEQAIHDILERNAQLTASRHQVERLVEALIRMKAISWGNYEATKPYRNIIAEALAAVEKERPNAKVSGAGTASAGLPGWQAKRKTE